MAKYLKNCKIYIRDELRYSHVYKRVRSWLAKIVEIFGPQHTLKHLRIELWTGGWNMDFNSVRHPQRYYPPTFTETLPQFIQKISYIQYCLEPLAKLYGIRRVDICGHVREDFSAKLGDAMSAKQKREIPLMKYGEETIMRKPRGRKRRRVTQSLRKWNSPSLNWDEV
jgi:hypothetical protein